MSGEVIDDLQPDEYTVEFKDILAWNTPGSQAATVELGQTTITATYTINNSEYQISVDTGTPGGRVLGAGTYLHNETVTLTAVPDHGWSFSHWTRNGQVVSTDAEYAFLATDDVNLIAHFEERSTVLPGVLMLLLDGEE
jgi:hypothetical protein